MKKHQCMLLTIIFLVSFTFSMAQLSPTETRILFEIQRFLEHPPALEHWNKWTNFCTLPPNPSLTIVCSSNHITELTIVGNRSSASRNPKMLSLAFAVSEQTLSDKFSLDSFFTVLTKLSSLQKLSLVSLGLWGQLPAKINRLRSLEMLNVSSNFIYGDIPPSVTSYQSLKSFVLSNNLLNGRVPDLSALSVLEELDLSSNLLGPEFPSLGNNLVSVLIRNNTLKSEIPQDFNKMNRLQVLDLSSNSLIGPIPSFLFSMPSIQYISLAKNELSGALATDLPCNINLSYVDISNNLLTGKLPSCLVVSNVANRTFITLGNCLLNTTSGYQRSTSFCQKDGALAVNPPERIQKEQPMMKLGAVLGIIAGIVAVLGVFGFLILGILKRLQRKRGSEYKHEHFVIQNTSVPGSSTSRHIQQRGQMASPELPPYHVFALEEINDATNNFDTINHVGEGSQGQIYKGRLRDGSPILVKCIKLKQKHSPQALQHHMEVVSKLRHRHIVSVLGHGIATYQDHPNTTSTVYIMLENIANGSLRDHLTDWRKREVLKWPQRMSISMGIARGIQYLHTGGVQGNDLKIENILLDESLTPKISSYKITLPSKVDVDNSLDSKDTLNHEDPEREDIYRLGVILTKMITGRPIQSKSESDDLKYQLERSLAESPSKLRDLVDPSMRGTFAYESLKTVTQITVNCLCKDPVRRPTVEDVLWHLQYSVQVQEGWTNSGNPSGNFSGNLDTKL